MTMKNPMHVIAVAMLMSLLMAQSIDAVSCDGRYNDTVFSSVNITRDVVYGWNLKSTGVIDTQKLDVYQPAGDSSHSRPLVVFIHGGGFTGGDKMTGDIVTWCNAFARRGYVTASMNYRLSDATEIFFNAAAGRNLYRAIYRAVQDAKAAVRFLRAHGTDYGIDTSYIFAGGSSAGGVTAVQYAYMDQRECTTLIDTAGLGPLEDATGTPGVSSRISGILNCWGAVGDTAWINPGELPVVSIHGTADATVPYDIGNVYTIAQMPVVYGSAAITRAAQRAGIVNMFKPFAGMGHGIAAGDPRMDTAITVMSDFLYRRLPCASGAVSGPKHMSTNAGPWFSAIMNHRALTIRFHRNNTGIRRVVITTAAGRVIGRASGSLSEICVRINEINGPLVLFAECQDGTILSDVIIKNHK